MDVGPYRQPRPAQGRVVSRAGVSQQVHEETQPVAAVPKVAHRASAQHHTAKQPSKFGRFKLPLIIIAAILLLAIVGWFGWSKMNAHSAIDSSKYQAVFFTNGQVYFGKLKPLSGEHMRLTDVYYLQTQTGSEANTEELQKAATDQNNVQLIKLGDEIHGPEDEMIISKEQMLFYENLKPAGKVAQSIEQFKKSQ